MVTNPDSNRHRLQKFPWTLKNTEDTVTACGEILANKQLDALFHVFIYFISLHVSRELPQEFPPDQHFFKEIYCTRVYTACTGMRYKIVPVTNFNTCLH